MEANKTLFTTLDGRLDLAHGLDLPTPPYSRVFWVQTTQHKHSATNYLHKTDSLKSTGRNEEFTGVKKELAFNVTFLLQIKKKLMHMVLKQMKLTEMFTKWQYLIYLVSGQSF